jgi:heme/copper-type cytochrome/quinol oxidase subunit 2
MTAIQTRPGTRPLLGPATVAGTAATALLLAGLYLDTPWKKQGNQEWALTTDHQSIAGLFVSIGFVAVGLAVVFGVVVSRGLRGAAKTATRRSLALAVTGAVSAVVFWTGLPVILAVGAVVLALDSRARLGRTPTTTWIVGVLAVLTVAAAVSFAFVG